MGDSDGLDGLRAAERRLQAAQLASDVGVLDQLIDDRLLFTGPDGSLLTKADDLAAHRSGSQALQRLDELDLRAGIIGTTGVTWVLVEVAGTLAGSPFAARLRYTRTWVFTDTVGWKVVAAQAGFVAPH